MAVYVDDMRASYGRMVMCHMLADTLEELLAMADRIGVARRWYQGFDRASCPHFDISLSKRALAVKQGAIQIDRARVAELTRAIKSEAAARVKLGQPHGWAIPA